MKTQRDLVIDLLDWLGDNRVSALASLLGSTALSILGGYLSAHLIAWIFGGLGIVIGLFLEAAERRRLRRLSPIRCSAWTETFELHGARGARAMIRSKGELVFRTTESGFVFARRRVDGVLGDDLVHFRNLGKRGVHKDARWHKLGNSEARYRMTLMDSRELWIVPPGPICAGDHVEARSEYASINSFPADRESCGKNVLYPTDLLTIRVEFDGCRPQNACKMKTVGEVPVAGSYQSLDIIQEGGRDLIVCTEQDVSPTELVIVSWEWAE